ncbi:MAG: hypothetical protein ACX939_05465 [Hyphococcus sp.]
MSVSISTSIPRWFWFAAGGALLWNLVGVAAFIMDATMSQNAIAQLPAEQQAMRSNMPAVVMVAYGVAVLTGALGAMMLLLRKTLATQVFIVSLAALLVQFGYLFLAMRAMSVMGPQAAILPAFTIIIGFLLVRFAMSSQRKGWLS